MLQFKTHSRRFSQQNLTSQSETQQNTHNLCPQQNLNELLPIQLYIQKELTLPNATHKKSHKHLTCDQHILDHYKTDRNHGQKVHFQNDIKKFNLDIQELGQVLALVSKQIAAELLKNQLISGIVTLMKLELESQENYVETCARNLIGTKNYQERIEKQSQKIQKVLNEKNKIISQQKKLLEQIHNERKIRLLYENYFHLLQKQIHKHQLMYTVELTRAASSKFLYVMTSGNDLVSNGQILTLKKEDEKENEKDLQKNSYMCLPMRTQREIMGEDDQENSRSMVKSSKLSGKKNAAKKLVKIMNFIATSKAIQTEQLELYEQEEECERYEESATPAFRLMRQRGTASNFNFADTYNTQSLFPQSTKSAENKRSGLSPKPRTGKMISLKFITQARAINDDCYDSTVCELFRIYQALGINIFAKKGDELKENHADDYFGFDEVQLLQQSDRRVQYMRKSDSKMVMFNGVLEKKIAMVDENVARIEGFIDEMERQRERKRIKMYEEEEEDAASNAEAQANKSLYHAIASVLGVNPHNYNCHKEIQTAIDLLLASEKQSEHPISRKKQSIHHLSHRRQRSVDFNSSIHNIQSRQSLPTFKSFIEKKHGSYKQEKIKTQGHQRKFTPLIVVAQNSKHNKKALDKTCRSIFQNGFKSLNNIFDNMNTCQQYQRVFEREEFEKEYSKEIAKKKRVMFRREAKVMPDKAN